MSGILIATLIISCLSVLSVGFIGYKLFRAQKLVEEFPSQIVGKIKSGRGVTGKLQKEMDELARMDIGKFIEDNPVVVDIFPTLIEKGIQRDAQPQMINSIIQLIAPAVTGLLVNNSNAPDALKAIASSGGGAILGGIFKALGAMRENAKKNYDPNKPKPEKEEKKKVHTQPKVKSI